MNWRLALAFLVLGLATHTSAFFTPDDDSDYRCKYGDTN